MAAPGFSGGLERPDFIALAEQGFVRRHSTPCLWVIQCSGY
jgi:hypothetical protein